MYMRRIHQHGTYAHRHISTSPAGVLLGTVLVALLWWALLAAPAYADTTTGAQKVAVFEDAIVGAGEVWDNVVVVGGDLRVEGGVKNTVVVVGGDVTVTATGSVGSTAASDDTVLVSVFGDVTVEPGASVQGKTVDFAGSAGPVTGAVGGSIIRTWDLDSILSWVWSSVFLAIVAAVVVAVAPRQIGAVRDKMRRRFFASIGWGALALIIVVPIVTAFLIITVLGILVAVPWLLIGLPLLSLFGFVAVGALVGRLLLRSREVERGPLMLAAVVGVVIVNLARWIPVAGVVILVLLWFVGVGATILALWQWMRESRQRRRV